MACPSRAVLLSSELLLSSCGNSPENVSLTLTIVRFLHPPDACFSPWLMCFHSKDEAIKWPDLNTHGAGGNDSHPLPVNNTGRSGFDTASESSLSRVPSTNYSTPDFNAAGADPYAVPPLPHLNPNQPYRDDPAAAGAYYDPYHGPVPGTIEHGAPGAPEWAGEAIPMTQLGGRMSPGPHAAYGAEPIYDHNAGRQSPGPQVIYGGRTSPGPQAAYGGGRMSPGPHAAYGGAMSPQPPMAGGYDAYSGR